MNSFKSPKRTFLVLIDLAFTALAEIHYESCECMPYGGVHVNVTLKRRRILADGRRNAFHRDVQDTEKCFSRILMGILVGIYET